MKKIIIFFVICLFLLALAQKAFGIDVVGNFYFTGEATSNQVSASITVISVAPTIFILSPKESRTYRSENILLNYSVYDANGISLVWYNIDNGSNMSLGNFSNGQRYFNVSQGMHTLYLYANNTLGAENFSSVKFYVNNTKIIVIYENFRGEKKGNSTDFDSLTDEELENLSGMVLENTDYGKILWLESINITADRRPNDKITRLDDNVVIANASIFVNETELPNLNKRATLWFYNLSFRNPIVLRNGEVCPASVCTDLLYFNKTLKVNVIGFTNYSVEETPEERPGAGGGAGGGGVALENVSEILFFFYPSLIKLNLMQGEKEEIDLKIKNLDEKDIEFQLSSDFNIAFSEKNFILKPKEEKDIVIYVDIPKEIEPDVYIRNVFITAKKENLVKTEKVKIVIAVSSKEKLFDVKIKIPEEYKVVKPGGSVIAEVEIYNLGSIAEKVDVELRYSLRDLSDNVLQEGIRTVAVQTKISEVIKLVVPKRTKEGRYIFVAIVTYNGQKAFASDDFYVKEERKLKSTELLLIIFIAMLIGILIWLEYRRAKHAEKIEKIVRGIVLSKVKLR